MIRRSRGTDLSLPIRVGLIGISGYGRCHFEMIKALEVEGLVSLVAATVINPDDEVECCREMRATGCRIYEDYQMMLRCESGRMDLCCIPTGIAWHCRMTLDALEAGCHVLVEKPVAGSVEEAEAMREAEIKSRLRVFVGFQNLFADDLWRTKRLLLDGAIGTLQRVRVSALWPRGLDYYDRANWAGKLFHQGEPVFDSPVNNAMAHFIMMALFWSGTNLDDAAPVRRIRSLLLRAQSIESFDTCSMELMTDRGVTIVVNMSHSTREYSPAEVILEGTEGVCVWGEKAGIRLEIGEPERAEGFRFPAFGQTRTVMLRHVVNQLQGGKDPVCSLALAKNHAEFVSELHQSSAIRDIHSHLVLEENRDGETYRVVEGLGEALLLAHRRGEFLEPEPWCETLISHVRG